MRDHIRLLVAKLPAGAEIHSLWAGNAGYIDNTFLRDDGKTSDSPYPVTDDEAAALVSAGAADCRQEDARGC
jgi:hypothetical protein